MNILSISNELKDDNFNFIIGALATKLNTDGTYTVLYVRGYQIYPTPSDIDTLINELTSNEEIGLIKLRYNLDYEIVDLTQEPLENYRYK